MICILLEEDEEKRLKRYNKLCKKILKYKIPIRKDRQYKIQRRPDNKNSYNKDMVGVLEIPKIKLKKSLYSKESIYNNVDKNLEILSSSDMPDKKSGNVIIAGHSGVGSKAYFNDLVKLNINDEAYIYYNNSKYIYKLNKVYEIDKTGNADIIRNKNISTLTLITCKINSNKQLIYIFYLESV